MFSTATRTPYLRAYFPDHFGEDFAVAALPAKRRVNHDGRRADRAGKFGGLFKFCFGRESKDKAGGKEHRRVNREDRLLVPSGQCPQCVGISRATVVHHHDFDSVEADIG